ncbi:MAG: formylglycine-generating enzyme family protein [Armatimonadota bacterium]|nr:formylglycine-generating enzyme family protein [Armatimonadota bacterium]
MRIRLWVGVAVVVLLSLGAVVAGAVGQPQSDAAGATKEIPLYDSKPGTKIGDVRINSKDGAEMMWVPAGEFLMGSSDQEIALAMVLSAPPHRREAERFAGEKPQRKVYLDGFWMYKYEVTVKQYRHYCEDTGRKMPVEPRSGWKDDHPIVNTTWDDGSAYAKWAEASLPTEAQWEKAARGTDGHIWPWGHGWHSSKCATSARKELFSSQPVGSCPSGASRYGCMDMVGNVWEWCEDWYDADYYKTAPSRNPPGPAEVKEFSFLGAVFKPRVLRGGSWLDEEPDTFRCAFRSYGFPPALLNGYIGVRCARTP